VFVSVCLWRGVVGLWLQFIPRSACGMERVCMDMDMTWADWDGFCGSRDQFWGEFMRLSCRVWVRIGSNRNDMIKMPVVVIAHTSASCDDLEVRVRTVKSCDCRSGAADTRSTP
jgi:hypothetical protein